MLARVAESLYWMGRYIERAEDLTRLIAVNFDTVLDQAHLDPHQGWEPLVAMNGDEPLFYEIYGRATAENVIEFMLWHPLNPNTVTSCITKAREDARSARDQISSEMWEHLNRLYHLLRSVDRAAVTSSPHDIFQKVRDGSQAFHGVALATMIMSEPYEFIRLGTHMERADKTLRILTAKYDQVSRLPSGSAEMALQLLALLRSCSAFEPFRRTAGLALQLDQVMEYLLLSRDFPRTILFCLNRCLQAIGRVGDPDQVPKFDHPRRSLGRLAADLEYLNPKEVLGNGMEDFLEHLLQRLNGIADDVSRTYFNTRVILPDDRPRQQQQQQQQ